MTEPMKRSRRSRRRRVRRRLAIRGARRSTDTERGRTMITAQKATSMRSWNLPHRDGHKAQDHDQKSEARENEASAIERPFVRNRRNSQEAKGDQNARPHIPDAAITVKKCEAE